MSDSQPLAVAVHGWTWASTLLALLNLLLGGVAVALVRAWPSLKKIATEREANLLTERAEEMDKMRLEIAALQAERQIDRHRINNLTQCFDALVMLIEQDPSKASVAVTKIKEMRASQMAAEALEKGAATGVKVHGVNVP